MAAIGRVWERVRDRRLTVDAPTTRPSATARYHLVTVGLGSWIVLGMALDSVAHNNLPLPETFLSPWHIILYTGFLATAAWIIRPLFRPQRPGQALLSAVPVGYELGLIGVLTFALGGASDLAWHTIFGPETDAAILLSPPHALLFLGSISMLMSPFMAAWKTSDVATPSLRKFLPTILSIALATVVVAFAFMYLWPFFLEPYKREMHLTWTLGDAGLPGSRAYEVLRSMAIRRSVSNIMLTNLVLLAPVLLVLTRWAMPFGSLSIFFLLTTSLISVPTALAAGLGADLLNRMLRPSPTRLPALRVFAFLVPVLVWSFYYATANRVWGLAWATPVWLGMIVWAGLGGLGLSWFMMPRAPTEADRPISSGESPRPAGPP